jgi:phosphoenolpyruvate phosphomutase
MHADRLIVDKEGRRVVRRPVMRGLLVTAQTRPVRLWGVNNALSAMLVEEAGFEGCWLSSFEAHASCRLPDADILSIADYADLCSKISDRISIPLIMDGDAGGGSPINTIRMVREYQKSGASGICIEDNCYPKRCSFYDGKRALESPARHAAKIRAICDNRLSDDFFVIARTEALIAKMPVEEAVIRAVVYAKAGADAVLIHHKGKTPDPIFEFAKRFRMEVGSGVPLICVPTTYNQVTEDELVKNGFSIVIYANYGIRSAVKAMQRTLAKVAEGRTLSAGNDEVVPMPDIFRLVGLDDLNANEKKYSV